MVNAVTAVFVYAVLPLNSTQCSAGIADGGSGTDSGNPAIAETSADSTVQPGCRRMFCCNTASGVYQTGMHWVA